ncbi:MAG: hypothetical protein E6K65_04435 [Nitrospirae bacterium]|nr:MAG: hypothetical protein E6K65_04435 [Nitrospirota bacterium]
MKLLLLKRNVSMTKTPLKELLSSIKMSRSEKKRKTDEALVEQFLSELREAGVNILDEGRRGNHFRLEQGKAGVEVSLHGSTDWGWWGVAENYIKKVEKWRDHWGVVFLTPKERFWVDGRNFRTIVTGDLDEANGYNIHRDRLKESSSANLFSSVREFLSISGLR